MTGRDQMSTDTSSVAALNRPWEGNLSLGGLNCDECTTSSTPPPPPPAGSDPLSGSAGQAQPEICPRLFRQQVGLLGLK